MEIGSSVSKGVLSDVRYRDLLTLHFDWWYFDQGFGWRGKKPEARAVMDLAVKVGKKTRGNCLLSATTTKYPKGTLIDKEEIFAHIRGIVENFPEIKFWDCTHESLNPLGSLRNSFPKQILGEKWQEIVFKYAHSLDSTLNLFYCDYFRGGIKWQAAYHMVSAWLDKGIPIKGISLQLHSNLKPSFTKKFSTLNTEECLKWMKKFRQLGLVIHVPETVCWQPSTTRSVLNKSELFDNTKERLLNVSGRILCAGWDIEEAQALVYRELANICLVSGVEMQGYWSAFDSYPWNWIGNRAKAGLWDENYQPKPCFYQILRSSQ